MHTKVHQIMMIVHKNKPSSVRAGQANLTNFLLLYFLLYIITIIGHEEYNYISVNSLRVIAQSSSGDDAESAVLIFS